MAGAIAEGVISKITEMIVERAAQEAVLVFNFTRDFDWLRKRLRTVSSGLKYADSLSTQDEDVKEWLHKVRDVMWDAEDIVEECAVRTLYTQSCFCNLHELLFRYRMGKRIERVKERIRSITNDGEQLKLFRDLVPSQSKQPSSSTAWKGNSLLPNDSHPVAIEPKLQHLISLIDESTVPVIAVVGMGEAGKTFLLQNAFHRLQQRYEHSIWLPISQSYSVHKLQCDLALHVGDLEGRVKDVSEERAAELIHAGLQGKESLIVLDDVWRATREENIITSLGLPIGSTNTQCKILVTTRSREVCEKLGALPYHIELLSEQESWQLFCAYAFSHCAQNLPPHYLEEVAHQVEKECGRLPLALKTMGASLSGCTDIKDWRTKLHQLKESELNQQKEIGNPDYRIIEILRLSYDSLPAALKPCFSYLSFFPEDEKTHCEYLINLWIAEGLIPQGEDQWEAAWSYLYELANLCLLEVWEDWNLIKYCKIPDLLFDLAINISKANRCTFAVKDVFTSGTKSDLWRRILLAKKEIDDKVIAKGMVCCPGSLRTLSLYNNPIEKIEANFFSPMRLLRVLDLSRTQISTLPQCVGNQKLLKLLSLSWTNIKEVPICVRSLSSLVMLDLSWCRQLQRLPEWINEMKSLEHLNIKDCSYELGNHMPKGISGLVSLRVLRSDLLRFSIENDGLLKLEDVAKLTHLQELSLCVQHEKELKSIEDGVLAHLLKMRHLSISGSPSTEWHLPQNITALMEIKRFELANFAVPNWVCMSTDLKHLTLLNCGCTNYPELGELPNLVVLRLIGNENCRAIPKAFGKSFLFPKLRYLHVEYFPLLEEFPDLEVGSMAALEKLCLCECPSVEKVPEGLESLKRLEWFEHVATGTDEFREKLSEGGEGWEKIKANNQQVTIKGYDLSI